MPDLAEHPAPPRLPAVWTTARLRVRDGGPADADQLTRLFNACSDVEPWDPTFRPVAVDELATLIAHSQATTGAQEGFRLQCLERQADGACIGYFHLHHQSPGLPQPRTPFISMFVVHPDHQRQRYAHEAAAGLAQQLADAGYQAIWLEVYSHVCPTRRP